MRGSFVRLSDLDFRWLCDELGVRRPETRKVLRLLYVDGLGYAVIAGECGWTEVRVRMAVSRFKRRLQGMRGMIYPELQGTAAAVLEYAPNEDEEDEREHAQTILAALHGPPPTNPPTPAYDSDNPYRAEEVRPRSPIVNLADVQQVVRGMAAVRDGRHSERCRPENCV